MSTSRSNSVSIPPAGPPPEPPAAASPMEIVTPHGPAAGGDRRGGRGALPAGAHPRFGRGSGRPGPAGRTGRRGGDRRRGGAGAPAVPDAGARAPGSAVKQDEAWEALVAALRGRYPGLPLVQGGRSNGARVACRTAHGSGRRGRRAGVPAAPAGQPGTVPRRGAARGGRGRAGGERRPGPLRRARGGGRRTPGGAAGGGPRSREDPARVGEVVAEWLDVRMRPGSAR